MARHDLKDRHVLITGASSGIGAALAVELARGGARVGLMARRAELLAEVKAAVEAVGGVAACVSADVTDPEGVAEGVAQLEDALGPTYGLVANAGIGLPTDRGHIELPRDAQTISINVNGVIHALAAVQPGMLERGEGFLSVVSSVAASRGLPGSGAYCASKAAVSTLFESLRTDLRGSGLSVIAIHPGFVATPMTRKNRFKMPFLMEPERAARIIRRALERGQARLTFPWQMGVLAWVMRHVPDFIWDRMGALRR